MKKQLIAAILMSSIGATGCSSQAVIEHDNAVANTQQDASVDMSTEVISTEIANNVLQAASSNFISAEKTFAGPDGLTGVVMKSPSGQGIAWLTPKGKNIIIGLVMNEKGENLSQLAEDAFIKKPISRASNDFAGENLSDSLSKLKSVTIGSPKSAKIIYIFGDLNCHYCESLYRMTQSENLMNVRIEWVPVAILGGNSLDDAIGLLASKSPEKALKEHHGVKKTAINKLDPASIDYASYRNEIEKNTNMLARLGQGTPQIIFWNGKEMELVQGAPEKDDFKSILKKVKVRK